MRVLPVCALLLALVSGSNVEARNFNERQRAVMEHIAQAFAGTARCPRYTVNVKVVNLLGIGNNFSIAHADVSKYVEERALTYRERFAKRTVDDICASLVRVYGPSGSGVANLVVAAKS